ncbi:MAG: hypothetical protein K9K37_01655 [Desulfocapsa sp.]|nr:hypothetical protein [Desulfocapsa sp.]
MKTISIVLLLSFFWAATASATDTEWKEIFDSTYQDKGIQVAVEKVLKEGVTPESIIHQGLTIDGLLAQDIVKSLYCAGVEGEDIEAACQTIGIPELIVVTAHEKATEECFDPLNPTQSVVFIGAPNSADSASGGSYASPHKPSQ